MPNARGTPQSRKKNPIVPLKISSLAPSPQHDGLKIILRIQPVIQVQDNLPQNLAKSDLDNDGVETEIPVMCAH